ncbi:MAG: hypothetical protein J7J25_03370 [Candidatus Omnitrophica bacterium]|nr:hypothetical protein [Candidatus Omnitrophota bacterium]
MDIPVVIDAKKGKEAAKLLYNSFSTTGIHGKTEMPEDLIPAGIKKGSIEHIIFLTLTVAIDYQRDAPSLWESSRKTFNDPKTNYLFNPKLLSEASFEKVANDMQKYKLSKKPDKDARIWQTIGTTFYKKWRGNPINFLENCRWDALNILKCLETDSHLYNEEIVPDYPYLRGPKIGPLWLRMLKDNAGITLLRNLDKVPIPVDIHVARATLAIGIVRGSVKTKLDKLFEYIRKAWFESVKGLNIRNRQMIALDLDEPLWHLSKYGCSKRDKTTNSCPVFNKCEMKELCIKGKIYINNNIVDLET